MAATSKPQPLTLTKLLSETSRVIKSQRRTFLALAVLFLFPVALAATLYPILAKSLSPDASKSVQDQYQTPTIPAKTILIAVAYFLFNLLFAPCAVVSITYAALCAFRGEPVKLRAAVESIAASFFPLLATQLVVFAATMALFLLMIVNTTATVLLGSSATPPSYLVVFAMAMFFLVFVALMMVYIQVNWTLASAVVVAESSWGFAPLKRSKALINGKRGLALCLSLIFGFIYLVFFWSNRFTADYAASLGGASRPSTAAEWLRFFLCLTLQYVFTLALLTLTNLYNLIANTVLYVYCAGGEYFCLPVDDEKMVSLV